MKLQKLFRSNSGFSMVEISVAMGLLGLASLAVMNLSDQVSSSTKKAEIMLSRSQFASSLGSYMYSGQACTEIKGMPAFTQTPSPIVIKEWKIAGFNSGDLLKDIGTGKEFNNFVLKSLTAALPNPAGMPVVKIGTTNYTKTFLNVRAEIEVKTNTKLHKDDPNGKRQYEYFYNIPVLADPTGKVSFCNEEKSIQETCVAMKGQFFNGKCELEKTCSIQGTYARLACSPTAGQTCSTTGGDNTPNPISGEIGTNCPVGASPIVTGTKTWSHIGTCSGKKCTPPTVTNILTYYACLDCPSGGGGTTGGTATGGTTGGSGGGSSGGSGGGCFVAGTQITLFGGEKKNIEDVVVGDSLVDHKGVEAKVESLKRYAYEGQVYSINGGPFFFTPNHPFLTATGWKSLHPKKSMEESPGLVVTKLKMGDVLLKKNGVEVLRTLDAKEVNEIVYNFTVSGSHEYIADDFAVHNTKAPLDTAPLDPYQLGQ